MATPDFLSHILTSGQFSDFKLICDGQEFKLHQAIVCPQSPVFNAALCGNFKEATSKEIIVDEFDASTVTRMVSFFYSGDYEVNIPQEEENEAQEDAMEEEQEEEQEDDDDQLDDDDTGDNDEREDGVDFSPEAAEKAEDETHNEAVEMLLCHLNVNAIANYYDIEKLRDLAKSKIEFLLGTSESILPLLLREVSTSNAHTNLYPIIATTVAEDSNMGELLAQEDLRIIEADPTLFMQIIAACDERISALERDVKDWQEALSRNSDISENNDAAIDACLAKLEETPKCRHCGLGFYCFIETGRPGMSLSHRSYMLRCNGCRTRHT